MAYAKDNTAWDGICIFVAENKKWVFLQVQNILSDFSLIFLV